MRKNILKIKQFLNKHLSFLTFFLIWARKKFRTHLPKISNFLSYHYRKPEYKNKLIFIHVAKAAGSSISEKLYGRNLGHMPFNYLFSLFGDDYDYFTVIREPRSRIRSSIKYAVSRGTNEGQYNGPLFTPENSLDELKIYLDKTDDEDRDPIFKTQSFFLGNLDAFDFIGLVERMDDVRKYLETKSVDFNPKRIKNKNISDLCIDEHKLNDIINKYYSEDIKIYNSLK